MTAKHFHISLLLLGFTLFVGCGLAIYFAPPYVFINQEDCYRNVCVAKFDELKRLMIVGIAYGIPVGLLAMMIAISRLRASDEE